MGRFPAFVNISIMVGWCQYGVYARN
jgi:hypothetical protein